jgi:hypothetical protein
MNMKKTILVIMTIVFALMFIACPDGKTPESNPPVANAQAEPTHTLADNLTITLDGTDSTGNISAYAWECESYTADQGTVSAEYSKAQVNELITNADTATATVAPRKAGTYVFRLTVTDNDSESDTDTVTVVVKGYTVAATINIPNSAFTEGTTLNLNPTFSGWNSDFPEGCVTYTLRDNKGNNWDTTGIVTGNTYGMGTVNVTLTQIFYYDSKEIITRNVIVEVFNGRFIRIEKDGQLLYDDENGADTAIPSLSLSLEKTITELP